MYNGMLGIRKEKGMTSHDVVNRLRRILGQKKIGHTGTLDPMAEGVLPVCLGSGTKLTELFVNDDKQYRAVLRLGVTTDTQDMTGKVLTSCPDMPAEEQVLEAVASFAGEQWQMPPMYSAIKHNGKKLYQYARAGIEIERQARKIMISRITVEAVSLPFVTILVDCSKGTYIRSLCEDIGSRLGCGAALEGLVRTRSGAFLLSDCISLPELEELQRTGQVRGRILPVDSFFPEAGEAHVRPEADKLLHNGNPLTPDELETCTAGREENLYRAYDSEGTFIGVYRRGKGKGILRPEKMFTAGQA